MSEDRFAGLDLDDSFDADYVAKKQEPEPAKDEFFLTSYEINGGPVVRPSNPYLGQPTFGGTTQYINTGGQQYQNALAGVGQGLNNYVAPSYGQNYGQRRLIDKRVEYDAVTDGYHVMLTWSDGSRERLQVSSREDAYSFAKSYGW